MVNSKIPGHRRGQLVGFAGECGFTLVEAVLTLSFLAIIAVLTAGLLVPLSNQARLNREVGIANAEVKRVLERIQATPFSDIPGEFPDGQLVTIDDLPNGQVVVTYEDIAADPLEMQVTVSWESLDQGPISWQFHTARTE